MSLVMQEFEPHIPRPQEIWPEKNPEWPYLETTNPIIRFDPVQLKELLDAFHAAVKAAEVFDRITGQPDCVDPEKAKLEERVAELEAKLSEVNRLTQSSA